MSRRPRDDHRAAWWHLFNRGIAKRAVFETALDVERFLALIRAACDDGEIEVHAYSVLTTHYHLLARSPRGDVSSAMQRIGNAYVRWFNRSRKRDGPLFRGRFGGRRIDDGSYWLTVLRYIDLNAPRAGICTLPSDHLHGSARAYRHGDAPAWLRREAVERAVADSDPSGSFRGADYDAFASSCDPNVNAHLVERLMKRPSLPAPRFADLVRAASHRQQAWMAWKAALADATVPGTAFLSPGEADRAARAAARAMSWLPAARSDPALDLRLALLHDAAGLGRSEVARFAGVGRTRVFDALTRHASRLASDPSYDELVSRVLRSAVSRSLPAPTHAFDLPMRVAKGALEPLEIHPVP